MQGEPPARTLHCRQHLASPSPEATKCVLHARPSQQAKKNLLAGRMNGDCNCWPSRIVRAEPEGNTRKTTSREARVTRVLECRVQEFELQVGSSKAPHLEVLSSKATPVFSRMATGAQPKMTKAGLNNKQSLLRTMTESTWCEHMVVVTGFHQAQLHKKEACDWENDNARECLNFKPLQSRD